MTDVRCVAQQSRNLPAGFAAGLIDQGNRIAGMPLSAGAVFPMLRSDNITLRRAEVGIGETLFVAVPLIEFAHCRSP